MTHMGEKRNVYWAFVGKPERKRSLDNQGRIVLKWILKKWDGRVGLFILLRRTGMNMGNKPLGCLTLRRLMSYIYGAPILDVSRSHTMTQHSR